MKCLEVKPIRICMLFSNGSYDMHIYVLRIDPTNQYVLEVKKTIYISQRILFSNKSYDLPTLPCISYNLVRLPIDQNPICKRILYLSREMLQYTPLFGCMCTYGIYALSDMLLDLFWYIVWTFKQMLWIAIRMCYKNCYIYKC